MSLFASRSGKPVKTSIDFSPSIYSTMQNYKARHKKSNNSIVNDVLNAVLPISADMRRELRDFCFEKMKEKKNDFAEGVSFDATYNAMEMAQWKVLGMYFDEGATQGILPVKMRKLLLQDGYAIIPRDNWILLGDVDGKAEECMYMGVVECRNGANYGEEGKPVPHFAFFTKTKYSRDYSPGLEAKVYQECGRKYPRFKKLFNMQASREEWDAIDYNHMDEEAWEKADMYDKLPQFALFNIPEKGDPYYWNITRPNYYPPAGAMVIRNKMEEEAFRFLIN